MSSTDHRPGLFAAYEQAAEIVAALDSGDLQRPTPCPDYDVATLVDHIVGAGHRAAALGRGEAPSVQEFPHIELAEAPDELRRARKEAQAAWAGDGALDATTEMPWGETYNGRTLVDMYMAELATHAWDLAVATGRLERLDDHLAVEALAGARAMLKTEYRNLMAEGSPFGSEVEAPPDATAWDRLAAFMGRDPQQARS